MYIFLPCMETFLNGCKNIRKINHLKHIRTSIIKDCSGGYSRLTCKTNVQNCISFKRTYFTVRNGNKYCSQFRQKTRTSSGYAKNSYEFKHRTVLFYLTSAAVLTGGMSYAAVPLYRIYCQVSTHKCDALGDLVPFVQF